MHIRRFPQISRIDNGRQEKKGRISANVNYSHIVQEPDLITFAESSFVSKDFASLTSRSYTTSYMASQVFSTSFTVGLTDFLSSGFALDFSLGKVNNSVFTSKSIINHLTMEIGLNVRAANTINKCTFGLKPELFIYTLNGVLDVSVDSTFLTGASIHKKGVSLKTTIFGRYQFTNRFSYFLGIQYKLHPYSIISNKVSFENTLGLYSGCSFTFLKYFSINPYVTIPVRSMYTGYVDPVQAGSFISFELFPESSESEFECIKNCSVR